MHYSVSLMPQYIGRRCNDDEPVWCVIEEYEPSELAYMVYPKGRNYLTAPGMMFLTKSQAERKAAQLASGAGH